ncbi:MAG: glycosyltransferase family 4 protein [candidate division KSB1 bacterium]|nr:glycosyltransferase family 4 protein [candidate division KSB1 bacterium]
MNICMFLMTEFIHDARVTKESRSLINAGNSITLIALKDDTVSEFEIRESIIIRRIKLFTRHILPKGTIFFFIKYLEFVLRSVYSTKNATFDVYHAHDLETLPIAFILSKLNNKPLIYDSHELYVDCVQHGKVQRMVWYQIEKFLAPRTTMNIMETQSRANVFAQRYKIASPHVIMNCQYLNIENNTNFLRQNLGIPESIKIIIYQGQIAPSRGVDIIIEAVKSLPDVVLVLIGHGPYRFELRKKVDPKVLDKTVFILDPVPWEELAKYTASADLGIFALQNDSPHYYYALSNKIFEYLSAGLPIVFSDFPEMRKVIVENNVGRVVNEKKPSDIAGAIREILSNPKLYHQMSENAIKTVKEKYNWHIESEKLLNLYNSINL